MMGVDVKPLNIALLNQVFGSQVQANASLARYTAARVGGPADALIEVRTSKELEVVVSTCWQNEIPCDIFGGGSNVLVSDLGLRSLVIVNRARRVRFDEREIWAESGVNFSSLARQAASRGLGGLEWAAGIPGTLGGAVFGNAGAHGGDMSGCLKMAEILHRRGMEGEASFQREEWPVERLGYDYRNSVLKSVSGDAIVLAATLQLVNRSSEVVQAKMDRFGRQRRRTQPPGASMGSMFKNPPGDFAGRLIDEAELKGTRIGEAEISNLHANFFVNLGGASAADIYGLLKLAQRRVMEQSGIKLELEIELLGEF